MAEAESPSETALDLYKATRNANWEWFERALAAASPADVNAHAGDRETSGCSGETPLLAACSLDKSFKGGRFVKALLAAGADANRTDLNRVASPLHHAAKLNKADEISMLVNAGANLELTVGRGNTALVEACSYGSLASAQALIKHGANVNATGGAHRQTRGRRKRSSRPRRPGASATSRSRHSWRSSATP